MSHDHDNPIPDLRSAESSVCVALSYSNLTSLEVASLKDILRLLRGMISGIQTRLDQEMVRATSHSSLQLLSRAEVERMQDLYAMGPLMRQSIDEQLIAKGWACPYDGVDDSIEPSPAAYGIAAYGVSQNYCARPVLYLSNGCVNPRWRVVDALLIRDLTSSVVGRLSNLANANWSVVGWVDGCRKDAAEALNVLDETLERGGHYGYGDVKPTFEMPELPRWSGPWRRPKDIAEKLLAGEGSEEIVQALCDAYKAFGRAVAEKIEPQEV